MVIQIVNYLGAKSEITIWSVHLDESKKGFTKHNVIFTIYFPERNIHSKLESFVERPALRDYVVSLVIVSQIYFPSHLTIQSLSRHTVTHYKKKLHRLG